MNYWLMKSEPDVFGVDHLIDMPNQTKHWGGVRNYQARNFMRDGIKLADIVLFYHSNAKKIGVAGTMKVVREAYPDHTQFDIVSNYYDSKSSEENPRWIVVDIKFVEKFNDIVTLSELKKIPELSDMRLIQKGNRLSINPVEENKYNIILELGRNKW